MLQVNIRSVSEGSSLVKSVYSVENGHDSIIDPEISLSNESIYNAIAPSSNHENHLLAPGCIYLSQGNSVAMFKQPASYRLISYKPFDAGDIEELEVKEREPEVWRYRIPIPSVLYLIILDPYTYHLQGMYAFCYTSPTLHQDTELFLLPLNNYYLDGKLCMSRADYMTVDNPYHYFNYLLNAVWEENFNYDTTGVMNGYLNDISTWLGNHPDFDPDKLRESGSYTNRTNLFYEFLSSISMHDAMNVIRWQPVHWNDSIDPGLTFRYVERYAMDVNSNSFNETSFINAIREASKLARHGQTEAYS